MKKRKGILLSVSGLCIVVVFLIPIYWMVISALKDSMEIFANPPTMFPKEIYLNNFQKLISDREFTKYLKNSSIIGLGSMFLAVVLAAPCAYGLARKKIKGAELLLFVIIIIQMVPSTSMALPLYAMFTKIKITNNYIGIIIANVVSSLPFVVLVLRTSFLSIPSGLEEAAYIDGCGAWRAFTRIILPLIKPALLTCATFSFVFAWGEFMYSLVLLSDKQYWPLTVGMRTFIGQYGTDWGSLMAAATLASLPIIIIFVLTQKYVVGGITAGAIKG